MIKRHWVALAAVLSFAASGALAQKKVYRCEEGGKVIYSDAPCKGGAEVKVDDARGEAQRKSAQEAVSREEKMAEKLARERHAAEVAASKQGAAGIPYTAAQKAAAPEPKPVAEKAKKKAKKPKNTSASQT